MKNQSNYLKNKRLKILQLSKKIIAEEGLTSQIFEKISTKYNIDINEINLLFPGGKSDFLKFVSEQLNIELEETCKKFDLLRMPVHKRIKKILLSKIYLMEKEKNFYKKIFFNLLISKKNISFPNQLYKSVDQIWYIAGDTSVDFNFYTKRLILAGVYSRVILYFFNNNNQKELEEILDLSLKRVAKIPELKSRINLFKDYVPKVFKFLKNSI
ncbi:COQ9 family protein [Pelagibacterales bacterium SAG-MED31]|nr:COQ9 family protein [Pelagibacterales bacterium SAG-MED31]